MKYVPALDGLRAFAVIAVVAFHSRVPGTGGGFLGVDLFFVLSGFLITSLLLSELEGSGTVNIRRFWLRRLARLTPALMLFLSLFVFAAPILWPDRTTYLTNAIAASFYTGDLGGLFWTAPVYGIGHTWSLAVEMHFYLVWPLLFLWLRFLTRQQLLAALVSAYLVATMWRLYCVADGDSWREVYFVLDTRVSGLILGSALATALSLPVRFSIPRGAVVGAYAALVWLVISSKWGDRSILGYGVVCTELAASIVIVHAYSAAPRWLEQPALVWLGQMSYGFYLFHKPISEWLRVRYSWDITLLGSVAVGLGGAALSYYTIERHVLRLRSKLRQPAACAA